jgi:1,4-alpha-glucan branching enzyme
MRNLFFIFYLTLIPFVLHAQQDLFNENALISPEINADQTVTFRVKAPNAKKVSVSGSLDGKNAFADITYEMKKGSDGVWSLTPPVLPSEFAQLIFK